MKNPRLSWHAPLALAGLLLLLPGQAASARNSAWNLVPANEVPVHPPEDFLYYFTAFVADTIGNLYMADATHLFRHAQGKSARMPIPLLPDHNIVGVAIDLSGLLWALTALHGNYSLLRYAKGVWTTVAVPDCVKGTHLMLRGVDALGNAIVSASGPVYPPGREVSQVLRIDSGACSEIPLPAWTDGVLFAEGYTRDFAGGEYLYGSLSTGGDIRLGSFMLFPGPQPHIRMSSGADWIQSVHGMDGQVMAILGNGNGLGILGKDGISRLDSIRGKPDGFQRVVFMDSRKDVWIPVEYWDSANARNQTRILQLSARDTIVHTVPLGPKDFVTSIVEDDAGSVWFITYRGNIWMWTRPGNPMTVALSRFQGNRRVSTGLPHAISYRDALGRWLGSRSGREPAMQTR